MLKRGPAKKVTIYVNEDTPSHLGPLYEAILTLLMRKGIAGATATRAMAGFGPHQILHTMKIELLTQHLPIRIEFTDTAKKVEAVLPALYEMVSDGLIEVQDTTIIKAADKDHPQPHRPHQRRTGPAKLMRVFMGESDQFEGEPLYDAIVKRLHMMDISGATVYRGILGYGLKGKNHKSGFLHMSHDSPMMISVIDSADKIAQAASAIESMMQDGLIVVSDVDIVRLVHGPAEETLDANPPR
jgi:PII-like signaling protein